MESNKVILYLIKEIDSLICLDMPLRICYEFKVFEVLIEYKGMCFVFVFKIRYLEDNFSKYQFEYIYVDRMFHEDNTEVENSHYFIKDINNVLKYVNTEQDFINIAKNWKQWKNIMK